jgi:hypothetical protein
MVTPRQANIARIKALRMAARARSTAQARRASPPTTESWWTEPDARQWAVKAKAAAVRMGAVAEKTNYRKKDSE